MERLRHLARGQPAGAQTSLASDLPCLPDLASAHNAIRGDRACRLIEWKPWPFANPSLVGHATIGFSGGWIVHQVPVFRARDGSLAAGVSSAAQIDREGHVKLKPDGKRAYETVISFVGDEEGAVEHFDPHRPSRCRYQRRGDSMKATDEALRIALNLARNRGYAVFPVAENKHPTKPKPKNGDGGCKEATKDADQIKWLWQHWPGPLIGVRTGAESGIDVLDVDIKHDQTLWWWRDNNRRLLPTRTFETRSGGLHLIYQHEDGVRNTQGKIHKGVDTRGDGGYLVYWFADGFGCFDHTPPQPWPAWLLIELTRKDEPEKVTKDNATFSSDSAIAGIVRTLETAAGGTRNGILFWCANRLRERGFSQAEAETLLLPAVPKPNDPKKDRGTIASAYRGRAAA